MIGPLVMIVIFSWLAVFFNIREAAYWCAGLSIICLILAFTRFAREKEEL